MTIEELKLKDNDFNEEIFISKANNMIKKLYNATTLDELDTVDHFASDRVFESFKSELENAKKNGEKLVYEQVNVSTEIKDIEEKKGLYMISCLVTCKYYKYYNSFDGEFLHGDSDERVEVLKNAVFCKKVCAEEAIVDRCLGCGFALNANSNGKCPNCGRIYDLEEFDYYLDSFR